MEPDECRFQQRGIRTRMWVPPEIRDPIPLHASTRKSMVCFGAVSLLTGKCVRMLVSKFNSASFEAFLKKLRRHRSRDRRMVLVLDNAAYYHAATLRPLLGRYRCILKPLFLPRYSPQLAPIERVWKLARRLVTHNHYFPTLDELVAAVTACFNRWRTPNSVLRRLCGIT